MRFSEESSVNFSAVYARQLLRYGRGIALWEPSPTDHETCVTVVEIGDVGYIENGAFRLLFNAIDRARHPMPYQLPAHLVSLTEQYPAAVEYERKDCDQAGTIFASEGQKSLSLSLGLS
jgi:hypothetical protein